MTEEQQKMYSLLVEITKDAERFTKSSGLEVSWAKRSRELLDEVAADDGA
jgi:hypothetical protein